MSTKTALQSTVVLTPAYGRDYTSKAQVQADWDADKDFILNDFSSRWDGKPINRSQIESESGVRYVNIRYKKMRNVHVIRMASTKTARSLNLTYHTDPGHGWLEVPMPLLKELGIEGEITPYSMRKGQVAYLEEDLDMGTFLRAAKEAGWSVRYTERYKENTPLRNYPGYRRASDEGLLRSAALKRASELPVGHPTRKKILAAIGKEAEDPYDVARRLISLGDAFVEDHVLSLVKEIVSGLQKASREADQGERRMPGGMVGDRIAIAHLKKTLIPQLKELNGIVSAMLAEAEDVSRKIKGY